MSTFIFCWRRPTPPLFIGGAEITQNVLAKNLAKKHNVIYIGSLDDPNYPTASLKEKYLSELYKNTNVNDFTYVDDCCIYKYNNILCVLLSQFQLSYEIEKYLKKYIKNDSYMITGMEESSNFIKIAKSLNVKTVAWLHSVNLKEVDCVKEKPDIILSTSKYIQYFISQMFNIDSFVFYPQFDETNCTCTNERKFITFINPVPEKGCELFLQIANKLKNTEFLVVEGWYKNVEFLENLPKNTEYLEKQNDMNKVWSITKLLLVPSKVEEAFGRVVVEASHNHIPVIASNKGGIPEALNNSGCLLDYNDADMWIKTISHFIKDENYYNMKSFESYKKTKIFYIDKTQYFLEIMKLS